MFFGFVYVLILWNCSVGHRLIQNFAFFLGIFVWFGWKLVFKTFHAVSIIIVITPKNQFLVRKSIGPLICLFSWWGRVQFFSLCSLLSFLFETNNFRVPKKQQQKRHYKIVLDHVDVGILISVRNTECLKTWSFLQFYTCVYVCVTVEKWYRTA